MPEKERGANGYGPKHQPANSYFLPRGYTRVIGDQGEFYCRSLYGLMKNRERSLRPDLVSVNGSFRPKLSMEVKTFDSARDRAEIDCWALTYGLNSATDFNLMFGDCLPEPDYEKEMFNMEHDLFSHSPVAFYYNFVQRQDGLRREELGDRYSELAVKLGNQMIVPHSLVFYEYVAGLAVKTGMSFDDAFERTKKTVLSFLKKEHTSPDPSINVRQEIHYPDFLYFFTQEDSLIQSNSMRERVSLIERKYGDERLSNLGKVSYVGPSNTRIEAMYKPEHEELFETQLKGRIAQRRAVLTKLARQREEQFKNLPSRFMPQVQDNFIYGEERQVVRNVDCSDLEMLLRWQHPDDHGPEFSEAYPECVETHSEPPREQAEIF